MSSLIGKYEVVIIEEGLGNLNDLSYYTRQAIESAVANRLFEGAHAYADHPDKISEQTRPERSVRDLIGFYSDTRVVDNPDGGAAMLVGTLATNPGVSYEWSRALIETAIDHSGKFDKDLIGISINAGGGYEKKDIDDVLSDATLPISVKPKLMKAKREGATSVDWCVELADVVSADLVTRAGARGRALKRLIESERNRMATPKKVKENEEKKEALPPVEDKKDSADAPAGDHKDEDQDKELISGMLKKYVGGEEHSEDEHAAMKEAHEAAKSMGLEGEEAEKAAGYSMKMAKHAAEKKESKGKEDGMEGEEPKEEDKKEESAAPSKMESEVARLTKLNAGLTKKIRESEVKEFLQKTIRESGFEGKLAKTFLSQAQDAKSEAEITRKAKDFKETIALASGGSFYINPEKIEFNSDATGVSFADCVKEN